MSQSEPVFDKPGAIDRVFNAVVTTLVRAGIGPSHMRVLEVRGRKSGRLYSLPVDLLDQGDSLFLVAPRGYTQWVRNAEASGEIVLRRGRRSVSHAIRPVADPQKPPILKAYLDRFHREVQRFFPVPAGSPVEDFAALVTRYPVFELLPAGTRS